MGEMKKVQGVEKNKGMRDFLDYLGGSEKEDGGSKIQEKEKKNEKGRQGNSLRMRY